MCSAQSHKEEMFIVSLLVPLPCGSGNAVTEGYSVLVSDLCREGIRGGWH